MNNLFYIYLLIILINSIVVIKNQNMQRATLALGKYLAMGNNLAPKNGFQDAITPKSQNWSNNLLILNLILIIVGFFIFPWYLPFITLTLVVLIMIIVNIFQRYRPPQPISPLVGKILGDLARRSANYRKKGDKDRAEAAKEMSKMITVAMDQLYSQLGDNPTIEQLEIITGQKTKI